MSTYVAEIKEVGNTTILTPSVTSDGMTKDDLIEFWGVDEPDVEWYRLFQIVDGQKVKL